MDSLWRDAVEVAAARLAVWDQAKSVAVAGRHGTASPFTAADFPVAAIEIVNAAARIQAG
jgi:hypothetical protein